MHLTPYESFRLFDPFWSENDQLFKRRGKEDATEWLYRVDVEETKDKVHVTAEIPGIADKNDLNIELDENVLTIRGEVKRSEYQEVRTARYSQRYFGSFARKVILPAPVKTDGAHASYRNGVLELSFLKDPHPAARTIQVDFQ